MDVRAVLGVPLVSQADGKVLAPELPQSVKGLDAGVGFPGQKTG